MLKRIGVVLASLVLASNSYAATLTVVADAASYITGQTITLGVVGIIDLEVEVAPDFFVTLDVPGNVSFVNSTAEQAYTPVYPDDIPWTVSAGEGTVTGGVLSVFDQTWPHAGSKPFANNFVTPGGGALVAYVFAIATFIAGTPGLAGFNFESQTNFFGITGASPGVSVSIVPEPTTAALLALGLLGLAAARSHRLRGHRL